MGDDTAFGLTVLVIFLLISFSGFQTARISDFKYNALKRGYAAYCPNNGEWSWTGECEE